MTVLVLLSIADSTLRNAIPAELLRVVTGHCMT